MIRFGPGLAGCVAITLLGSGSLLAAQSNTSCSSQGTVVVDHAIEACDAALKADGQSKERNVELLLTRAELYTRKQVPLAAYQDYSLAIKLEPADARLYDLRGHTLDELKKFEWALDDFDKAVRINPKFAEAFAHRAATFEHM